MCKVRQVCEMQCLQYQLNPLNNLILGPSIKKVPFSYHISEETNIWMSSQVFPVFGDYYRHGAANVCDTQCQWQKKLSFSFATLQESITWIKKLSIQWHKYLWIKGKNPHSTPPFLLPTFSCSLISRGLFSSFMTCTVPLNSCTLRKKLNYSVFYKKEKGEQKCSNMVNAYRTLKFLRHARNTHLVYLPHL